MMNKIVDQQDWKVLLRHVLRQAIDDYIKLQHPSYRQKKYLQETFQDSVDMFFDPEYRFEHIQNDLDEEMSLNDFLEAALDSEKVNIKKLQEHVASEARKYWTKKKMDTIVIPDMFCIEGHAYDVAHTDNETYAVDYESRKLYMSKTQTEANEEQFVKAMCEILCYHLEVRISKRNREDISEGLYRALKANGALRYSC